MGNITSKPEGKQNQSLGFSAAIVIVLLILSFIGGMIVTRVIYDNEFRDEMVYLDLLKIEVEHESLLTNTEYANQYYDEAIYSYDRAEYDLVISHCENSRFYSDKFIKGLGEMKSDLKSNNELIVTYKDLINTEEKIYFALYEACEYFERVARNIQADNLELASSNIELMNKRIKDHDDFLFYYFEQKEDYNQLILNR